MQFAEYQIRIFDTAGNFVGVFPDTAYRSLDYELRLNDFGIYTFVCSADDARVALFQRDSLIEIWRRPDGYTWYRDATFFHITPRVEYTETDLHLFTSYGRGLLDLIHRRQIEYRSLAFSSQTGPGEDVINTYVDQNAGPGASNLARVSDGTTFGLALTSSAGRGSDWTGDRAFRNLLDVIQEVGGATEVDFEIIRQGLTGTDFLFRTAVPAGTDRRNTVKFGTKWGNLLAPSYTDSGTEEINSVVSLGNGSGASRTVYLVQDAARIADSPWNKREGSANAGGTSASANLISTANEALAKGQPVQQFTGKVLQTPSCQYGVHYFLGDYVTVELDAFEAVKKIVDVHINTQDGRETIDVQFADLGRV